MRPTAMPAFATASPRTSQKNAQFHPGARAFPAASMAFPPIQRRCRRRLLHPGPGNCPTWNAGRTPRKRNTLTNMHDLQQRPVVLDTGLDEAPITAADELGAIGELTTARPEPVSHRRPASHRAGRFMRRLGHVPEHEVPHPSRRWLVRATALLIGVLGIGTAFIAS